MSKKILARTDGMLREEWLVLRKQGIGGSDAAAACGLSRWNSPLGLWLEKTSSDKQSVYNEAMFWGTTLEPVIRDVFSTKIGKVVEVMPYIFQSEDYPFMIADIDGIVREDDGSVSLVEIKTVSAFKAGEWADGLPAEYYIQIQHYLAVCELPRAYVVYLIGGNELHYEIVERDEETISTIIMLESAFWDKVVRRQKPDVDENSAEALDQLYPASNKTSIILPDEADKLLDDYMAIKAIEDDVKKQAPTAVRIACCVVAPICVCRRLTGILSDSSRIWQRSGTSPSTTSVTQIWMARNSSITLNRASTPASATTCF